jgi:predicted nucleic acid-binding Zn ribbon protein
MSPKESVLTIFADLMVALGIVENGSGFYYRDNKDCHDLQGI